MKSDLELAVEAARGAGEILHRAFRGEHEIEYKSEDQPVTEADRAADRFLRRELLGARPGYGCVSEEGDDRSAHAERVWVVDPLDGTSNFIEGRPEFAVSIGLVEWGTPVLGVVYNPESGALYTATRGGGAYRDGRRVQSAPYGRDAPRLVASWAELDRGHLAALEPHFSIETLGSTVLKVARVAEGRADLYASVSRKRSWDVTAAAVIAEESGAHVTDGNGDRLDFNDPGAAVNGLIVIGAGGAAEIERMVSLLGMGETFPNQEGRE